MEPNQYNKFSYGNFENSLNFKDVLDKYLIHLKWFFFSVIAFGLLAFFYLRYETPKYKVSATILIKEQEKGSSVSSVAAFEDLGLFGANNNSLENEIHLLSSRRLMERVVKELKLNINYFVEDSPYDKEQYPNFPIIIKFKSDSIDIKTIGTSFKILVKSKNRFEFFDYDETSIGNYSFGKDFQVDLGNEHYSNKRFIRIDLNENFNRDLIGKSILVYIFPLDRVIDNYNKKMIIESVDDKSRVLELSLEESIRQKGIAIINNLIEQYNDDAVEDKNQVYKKTTDFLNDRIKLITSELNAIESTVEQFKTSKGLIDTKAGSGIFLESSSANEKELIEANTQLQLVNYMTEELDKNNSTDLLPSNIGLVDVTIISLIGEFNTLILQRNRILKSSSTINPIIVGIDSQLATLKNNLVVSFNTLKISTQIRINAIRKQSGRISSRIASVPKNEREFNDIVRQQETKNAVYLFLLQKREESILSNAITIDNARIVDKAYSNGYPISPKPSITYFAALLLGLLLPAGIIFIKDSLDTKVHNEKDLVNLRIPYIGDVPIAKTKKDLYIKDSDNSNIAEAFRYIRTNIYFMLDSKKMGKTIFVTSTQSGEGKTFTAINLALSLAISGKKTLLIGMDLRAPKITKYLDLEEILGVTNYIKNSTLTINEVTEDHTKFDNLHLINSGDIPPNPGEILMSKRVAEIFAEVKQIYEYIIVDTAPVGMVTDTIQISKYADLTIYVVRANYLDKRMLHIPEKLNNENKLTNMAMLINESDQTKGAYGYGYGYGNKNKTPWYKRIFNDA